LAKRSVLRPGKRLVIWRGTAPVEAITPKATKIATREGAGIPAGASVHVVRRGDNLWTIARRYRLSARDLVEWNRLDGDALLQPGQTLTLAPAQARATEPPATANGASEDPDSI
jgi:LysM repeat protein